MMNKGNSCDFEVNSVEVGWGGWFLVLLVEF